MAGRLLKWLMALVFLLLTAGCYGYREVDESAYVIALGIDKGRENMLSVSFQIAVPKAITGGGGGVGGGGGGGPGGDKGTAFVTTIESPTLLSALESVNAYVDRRATLTHTRAIIFSRDLAEESIVPYLAPLTRFREFRRNTFVMVTTCPAKDFLKEIQPVLEDNPAKYLELLTGGNRYTEFIPDSTFYNFYNPLKQRAQSPLAALAGLQRQGEGPVDPTFKPKAGYIAGQIPRDGGGKPELMGAAVFSEGKMVGAINGEEVGYVKMIRGEFRRTIMNLRDPLAPDKFIIFEMRPQKSPETKTELIDGTAFVSTRVFLEGTIISIQSGENYEDPDKMPLLEQAVEERLTEQTGKLVQKAQTEFRTDFFGFGQFIRKQFLTLPEWEQYRWSERFPEAEVDVTYRFRIRRTGLLHETRPVK